VGAAFEVNRLIKEIRAVALAASDMRQAAAAAEALANEHQNVHVMRALETAVVVCYWRPFASGNAVRLDPAEWTPRDAQEVAAHETLKALRDKVYAHTDSVIKIGGEKVRARDVERIEDLLGMLEEIDWNAPDAPLMFTEGWVPLNREALPGIAAFAHVQETRLIKRQRVLEAQLREAEQSEGARHSSSISIDPEDRHTER
jgi:hypothetical protein